MVEDLEDPALLHGSNRFTQPLHAIRAPIHSYRDRLPTAQRSQHFYLDQFHQPGPDLTENPRSNHTYRCDEFDDGTLFDDFDEDLLRQSDIDRARQAQEGRVRLSLPPNVTANQYVRIQGTDFGYWHGVRPGRPEVPHAHHTPTALQPPATHHPRLPQDRSSPLFMPSSPSVRIRQRAHLRQGVGKQKPYRRPRNVRRLSTHVSPPRGPDIFQHDATTSISSYQPVAQGDMSVVQDIELISTRELPDRFRAVFPFPTFNAMQSRCFTAAYRMEDNFVITAPTGSGKTVIFELAILRLISNHISGSFKIVYQAPTKALCCERQRDWEKKFQPLDLKVKELTGDTTNEQLRDVQTADLIVATPEKWDSMTRRWKDHERLVQMVKLFLIDEVHILKEDRGATLEAVVSRMKSVGTDVRFVALSATVPNFEDIATWLGRSSMDKHMSAQKARFSEEFRPVQLQKHVIGIAGTSASEFAFDKTLNGKLPSIIAQYSQRKPIIIFCFTRKSCEETARFLSDWWDGSDSAYRAWEQPRRLPVFEEPTLRDCAIAGVAFHHAGLSFNDKHAVERAYLTGELSVICCTSTLAVGVNLPCHFVIIKNTITYVHPSTRECSDLEMMQMLGRAGRPQFDHSAVAVILTRSEKVRRYELMVSGKEILESRLHMNLIEHLNAEIGLGTVRDLQSAKKWLSSTFLYVRLQRNPSHYDIDGDMPGSTLDERLEQICTRGLDVLACSDLTEGEAPVKLTEYGEIMARYAARLDTMQRFIALEPRAKVSEILSTISLASEFREIRFRQTEKRFYRMLNTLPTIKFPIPVNLDLASQKISLMIQAELGGAALPNDEDLARQRAQYHQELNIVFQHTRRLIRCVVDCAIHKSDSVSVRNALLLSRSMCSRVWDDSPLTMKQIESVGPVAVRKLVNAGIRSIEELELVDPLRLEAVLGRHPPYGSTLLAKVKSFPHLRLSLMQVKGAERKSAQSVAVNLKAEIAFVNEKPPLAFGRGSSRIPLFICLLAETSDGRMMHFRRTSAAKLGTSQDVTFTAELTRSDQFVTCYVMCDDVAGTMKHATVHPEIPGAFHAHLRLNMPKECTTGAGNQGGKGSTSCYDDYGDGGIEDSDLDKVLKDDEFPDIDALSGCGSTNPRAEFERPQKMTSGMAVSTDDQRQSVGTRTRSGGDWEPQRLANGKYACNHRCKSKQHCRHLCCKQGLDKAPKPSKTAIPETSAGPQRGNMGRDNSHHSTQACTRPMHSTNKGSLQLGAGTTCDVESVDLTGTGSPPVLQPVHIAGVEKRHALLYSRTHIPVQAPDKRPKHSHERHGHSHLPLLQREPEKQLPLIFPTENAPAKESTRDVVSMSKDDATGNIKSPRQRGEDDMFDGDSDLFADVMSGAAEHCTGKQEREKGLGHALGKEPTNPQALGRQPSPGYPFEHHRSKLYEKSAARATSPLRSASRVAGLDGTQQVPRCAASEIHLASIQPGPVDSPEPGSVPPGSGLFLSPKHSADMIPPGLDSVDPWLMDEFSEFVKFT